MTREERKRWRRCVASVVAGTLVLWAAALLLCVTANASGHGEELTAGQAAGAPLPAYIAGAERQKKLTPAHVSLGRKSPNSTKGDSLRSGSCGRGGKEQEQHGLLQNLS